MYATGYKTPIKVGYSGNLYSPPVAAPTYDILTGLQYYYKFDNNLLDSSGNGNTLTQKSGTTALYGTGVFGQSMGVGSGASSVPNRAFRTTGIFSGNFSNLTITIAAWLKSNSTGSARVGLYTTAFINALVDLQLSSVSPDSLIINVFNTDFDAPSAFTYATGVTNQFVHCAAVLTGGTVKGYVNGALVINDVYPADYVLDGSSPEINAYCQQNRRAQVDEFCVYNRALADADIAALYNGGVGRAPL